ncbi:MAG: hypothetical protein M3N14_02810 [Bacteroidota bacterium]|nr:hypothetical protein [Bacteroidota bacterium]
MTSLTWKLNADETTMACFLAFMDSNLFAQQNDLVHMLKAGRLKNYSVSKPEITPASDRPAVSARGLTLLKGLSFSNGRIEIDLRGRDVFQQSFLGLAFNVTDSLHYEVVYFRPFNFTAVDTLRKKHAIQYMSMPDQPWSLLRKEHPDQYESPLSTNQAAALWFHATILIKNDSVAVFVNHSKQPALKVKRLRQQGNNGIALWDDGLPGDFAGLEIWADH